MQKIFIFITLFLLVLNRNYFDKTDIKDIPPESEFIPLNSREVVEFGLNKNVSELFYSFKNQYADSDIVINLKVGKGFTTYCYVYDSYEKIKTDERGEYIDSLTKFTLTENSIVLKTSELSIKGITYYLVIKDIINSFYKDYISIFNEEDIVFLQNEKIFTIDKFYSKNAFVLSFSHNKNDSVVLELNIDNKDFSQFITIYSAETKEVIYAGERSEGEIKLNEDFSEEGEFIVEIESGEDIYMDVESSIILHVSDRIVKELKYGSPLSASYTTNKVFNFYVNLADYDYNDEGIVTFKFGSQVFNRKLLSHCFAKVIAHETADDKKFIPNMPAKIDDNEAVFSRLTGTSDIYQLYFKNNQEKVENKTLFLLIHLSLELDEHDPDENIYPEEFTVYLSDVPEKINLEEFSNNNNILNENIKLEKYVPKIYRVILPKKDEISNKLSYIFYTSEKIQVAYNNTMLDTNSHLYENIGMIYVLSNNNEGYDYTSTLFFKLYGFTDQDINVRMESNEGNIYYIHNEYRKIKSISGKIIDCNKPFYYIGDYGYLSERGYLYPEILYGKFKKFYKGKVNADDETVLINENEKYIIEDTFIDLHTTLDIVELKCEVPGFYQAHLLDDVDSRDINLYSRIYNYLPQGKNIIIKPILSPIQEDINFEIYTPDGKKVTIFDGEKSAVIDSQNKYYQVKYKKAEDVPTSFSVVSEKNAVISITLTNKDPFVIVEDGTKHVDYDSQLIVKLRESKDYESVNIQVTRIYHGYSNSLLRGNVDFAPKLIESEYDYITIDKSHKINLNVSNPYLRDSTGKNNNDENSAYYFIFSIDDPEMIQKDVTVTYHPIKEHDKIENGIPRAILNENEKYSLPNYEKVKDFNVVYQSCGNSLTKINFFNYEDAYITIDNKLGNQSYQLNKVSNIESSHLTVSINLNTTKEDNDDPEGLKGAIIGFSDQEISKDDINKYNSMKLNISQERNKVVWDALENTIQYDIFVLDEKNSYVEYLGNPCFLQSIKKNKNDGYIKYYTTNTNEIALEEKGNYTVAVAANVTQKIPLIYIYDRIKYDSSLIPPDDDGKDDKIGTIIFVSISLPLVLIFVVIVLLLLIKTGKKMDQLDYERGSLIRDSTQSIENQ